MKNTKYWLLLLIPPLLFFSCKKDFLDIAPTNLFYRENYVKNLVTLNEYLNGTSLLFNAAWAGTNGATNAGYADLIADNIKPSSATLTGQYARYAWSQDINDLSLNMSNEWRLDYNVIRACSFVVENIDQYKNENPAKANYMKGQALALRAIMHFKLVNIFAQSYPFTNDASHLGIPYITTDDVEQRASRQTVNEVYNSMIKDLIEATSLLNETSITDIRFINKEAVKAFLARVYLFKGDFAEALKLAKEVCTQHPLMTQTQGYPIKLFYQKVPSETEVLFQLTPSANSSITQFIGGILKAPQLRFYATSDLASLLKERSTDVRSNWVLLNGSNWEVTKFPSNAAGGLGSTANLDYYEPLIRSSEMFVTVAESAAKTGDEETARDYLNALRQRADLSAPDIQASGTELLDLIYKERRKELCLENLRMYDLQRLKLGVQRIDILVGAPASLSYGSNKSIAPIPINDVNIAGLEPNPGY